MKIFSVGLDCVKLASGIGFKRMFRYILVLEGAVDQMSIAISGA